MEQAVRYIRYSQDGQSNFSIQRQEVITDDWSQRREVNISASFIDDGYSARNFDRPDIKNLFSFIEKNCNHVNILLVSDLSRFSRDVGPALMMASEIQCKYNIRIASAAANQVYDVTEPSSLLMMSLEFTLATVDNLTRINNIKGGINAAKTKEGRYIASFAPYGYKKEGSGKNKTIVIEPYQAKIVQFAFNAYAAGLSIASIRAEIKKMGYPNNSNSVIQTMLANPTYAGLLKVEQFKNTVAGLYPGKHEPIIDMVTYRKVQNRIKYKTPKGKPATENETLWLRSAIHSECGRLMTGGPSQGRKGKKYYYYRCHGCKQYIKAEILHENVQEIFRNLSLPVRLIEAITARLKAKLNTYKAEAEKRLSVEEKSLSVVNNRIKSVELKFIDGHIRPETYKNFITEFESKKQELESVIDEIKASIVAPDYDLKDRINDLCKMGTIFEKATATQKKILVNTCFDKSLYYKDGSCRTAKIMSVFLPKVNVLAEKGLLFVDVFNTSGGKLRDGGEYRSRTGDLLHAMQAL